MPRITLHPSGRWFDARPGETVLQAATRCAVPLPRGCRVGACRTCTARLLDGHLSMPPGTALSAEHLAEDLFLPCVAVPRSDLEIEVGDRIGGLEPLPWTD